MTLFPELDREKSAELLQDGFTLGQLVTTLLENQPKFTVMIAIAKVFHHLSIPMAGETDENLVNFYGYDSTDPRFEKLILELKDFVVICESYSKYLKTGELDIPERKVTPTKYM
jgi:hypothetical protein